MRYLLTYTISYYLLNKSRQNKLILSCFLIVWFSSMSLLNYLFTNLLKIKQFHRVSARFILKIHKKIILKIACM